MTEYCVQGESTRVVRGGGQNICNDRIFCAGRICKSGEGGQNAMTECAGANLQE